MLASVAAVATITASANDGSKTVPLLTDVVTEAKAAELGETLVTYYFYMPETWRNEHNDYYDGTPESCAAGVYWWSGPDEFKPDTVNVADPYNLEQGWPGYAVTETLPGQPNIFVARVPKSVNMIIFSNLVDGGTDKTSPIYAFAAQTKDAPCEYYGEVSDGDPSEDGFGFYPQGTPEDTGFDKWIFVCDPNSKEINALNGKVTEKGCFLRYYGDGEYGVEATREEAAAGNGVYKNGEFPKYGLQISSESESLYVGDTTEITPNMSAATVTVTEGADVISADINADTKAVAVKALKVGTAKIEFKYVDEVTGEETVKTCTITVKEHETTVSAKAAKSTIYVGATTKVTATVNYGKGTTTYASSKKSVATVDKNGKVTAKKAGTATITVTNNGKKATVKITVKAPKLNKTKVTLKVKKTFTIKITGKNGKQTFKSDKKKIATVNSKGKVTAKKKGSATITVTTNGGVKLKLKVTVKK